MGLVFTSRLWILLSLLVSHPSRHYFSYFFCLLYMCMYVWLNKQQRWHMLGCGSAGKFYFLSLLVNQFAPWIRCVFHGSNKVHRANKALKQLRFAFQSYFEQGARSFSVFFTTGADLLQVTIAFVSKIFSFSDREKVIRSFRQALLGCSMLQQNERSSRLSVYLTSSEMVQTLPADFMATCIIPRFVIF